MSATFCVAGRIDKQADVPVRSVDNCAETCCAKQCAFRCDGGMSSNSAGFPPPLVLAAIRLKATLCLSDLEERLGDSAELGNRHLAGEQMRGRAQSLPAIHYLSQRKNIMARWFAIPVINNEPPPLNSALMAIIKSLEDTGCELTSLRDTKGLAVAADAGMTQ